MQIDIRCENLQIFHFLCFHKNYTDHVGHEQKSEHLISSWLTPDEQTTVVDLSSVVPLAFITDQSAVPANLLDIPKDSNIIIHVGRLVQYFKLGSLFRLIEHYRKRTTKQIFTWVTVKCIADNITIPSLEHMANVVVTLADHQHLHILTKKSGGSIVRKFYQYKLDVTGDWMVKEIKYDMKRLKEAATIESAIDPESFATFKINVDGEEELIARNALKLPYER